MLISWKGKGIWALPIFFIMVVGGMVIPMVILYLLGFDYEELPKWLQAALKVIANVAAAWVTWVWGKNLNKPKERILKEGEIEEEPSIMADHSFFYINAQYWGLIMGIMGIIIIQDYLGILE